MMSDPTAILAVGDLHGDPEHTAYVFQAALDQQVQAIVQCGDYGYWEHEPGGPEFLDWCSDLAVCNGMPLYWLDGNHENHPLLRRWYGPGAVSHGPTPEGFWTIRDGVFHLPRGIRWVWSGRHLMGLGGAYSVDKWSRLDAMARTGHELWWPEEELTDDEVAVAVKDPAPLDVLFTHDKPRASNPRWNRKDLPDCHPNQDRVQTVVNTLHPKLLIHGHLHYRYTDEIMCGDGCYTKVEGLDCNLLAQEHEPDPAASWLRVQLV